MTKYLFVYHAPMTPAEAAPPTPEQMEAVMGEWNAWAGRVGDGHGRLRHPARRRHPGHRRTAPPPAPARSRATRSSRPPTWTPRSTWPRATRT